jgi:hypothetical protein
MKMKIYEEKILKKIRSNREFIEEKNKKKRKSLVDDDEDLRGEDLEDYQERCRIHRRRLLDKWKRSC